MSGVDPKLLEILVCPLCKGKLVMRKHELVCKADRLGYPTLQAHARLVAPILERLAHAGARRGSR